MKLLYKPTYYRFKTAVKDSSVMNDADGDSLGWVSAKFFDSSDVELTTQDNIDSDCVKSVCYFKPPCDYWIDSFGHIQMIATPTVSAEIYFRLLPNISTANGGKINLTEGGFDLRFLHSTQSIASYNDKKFFAYDGGSGKNELAVIVTHPLLFQEEIQIKLHALQIPNV